MSPEQHLNNMIQLYSRIEKFPPGYAEVLKIDKPLRWILADERDQYISVYKKSLDQKLLDIDIVSCFPTICNYLFLDENPEFIEDIAAQPTKLAKNILISNTLKGTQYLKVLNIISKMVILGFVFDRQDSGSVSLLEFEKDGCLIFSDNISYYKSIENEIFDTPFLEFIHQAGFKFRTVEYDYYLRCNNTSWFWSDHEKLRMKGMYKHTPPAIKKFYDDVFSSNEIDIDSYTKIYNIPTLKFIQSNNLQTLLQNYYFCGDDNKILNASGRFEKYHWKTSQIDPVLYLKTFVFPVWVFQQRNLSGIV